VWKSAVKTGLLPISNIAGFMGVLYNTKLIERLADAGYSGWIYVRSE
jgi:hypothetical protein